MNDNATTTFDDQGSYIHSWIYGKSCQARPGSNYVGFKFPARQPGLEDAKMRQDPSGTMEPSVGGLDKSFGSYHSLALIVDWARCKYHTANEVAFDMNFRGQIGNTLGD
jgi:hypothetical protein